VPLRVDVFVEAGDAFGPVVGENTVFGKVVVIATMVSMALSNCPEVAEAPALTDKVPEPGVDPVVARTRTVAPTGTEIPIVGTAGREFHEIPSRLY
jgi:hypothetical protein